MMLIIDQNSHWIFAVRRRIHGLQIPHTNSYYNAPFNVYVFLFPRQFSNSILRNGKTARGCRERS